MPIKLANNASGLLATAISASDTGIVLRAGDGAEFPALGAGDYFYATLTSTQGTQEIVKVTARVGDTMTVVRAQEGTIANGFAVDTRFELRVTAASVDDRADLAESEANAYADGLDTTLRANLAANSGSSLVGYIQGSSNSVATTVQAKLRETVSVKDFGAVGDGVTDDRAAIEAAWAASKDLYFPPGTYYAPGLVLNGGGSYTIKRIVGSGQATITGDDLYIVNMFDLSMSDISFIATNTINLEGLRYCKWNNVEFNGFVQWGRFGTTGLSSWSTYWSQFNQCKFQGGIHFQSAIAFANINSNTFNTCEFRAGAQPEIMKFTVYPGQTQAFASNTFVGCDFSYAPVFNVVDSTQFWAVTIVGGYLDSGTALFASGSLRPDELEIFGIRNPGSSTLGNEKYSASIRHSSGGFRPRKYIPAGALNLIKNPPTRFTSPFAADYTTVPVPWDGEYSASFLAEDVSGVGVDAVVVKNITTGGTSIFGALGLDRYSNYTFSASKGDVLAITIDGRSGTDLIIHQCSITAGAAIASAIPYRTVFPTDDTTTNCPEGVATTVAGPIGVGSYSLAFYKILVYTKNPVTGGGGEKIEYTLGVSASSTSLVTTLTEVTRTSRNGNGGTSLRSGSFALSVTTSGLSFSLIGTMTSGSITEVNATVKIYSANTD